MIAYDLPVTPRRHQHPAPTNFVPPTTFTPDSCQTLLQQPPTFHPINYQYSTGLPDSAIISNFASYSASFHNTDLVDSTPESSLIDVQLFDRVPSLVPSDSSSTAPTVSFEPIGLPSPQSSPFWGGLNDPSTLEHCSASKFRDFYSHDPDEATMAVLHTESLDPTEQKAPSYHRSPSRPFSATLQSDPSQFRHPRRRRFIAAESRPQLSHIRSTQSSSSLAEADESTKCSRHLPTPTDTPTHDSFAKPCQNFASENMDSDLKMSTECAPRPFLLVQNSFDEDDVPGFTHSASRSASSHRQTPTTPLNSYGEDSSDRKAKLAAANGKTLTDNDTRSDSFLETTCWMIENSRIGDGLDSAYRPTIPNLNRTMSDVYQDELYNPFSTQRPSISVSAAPTNPAHLSPSRNSVYERLQAANAARSSALDPSTSAPISPFRQNSPLAAPSNALRVPALNASNAHGDKSSMRTMSRSTEEAQTISPKEAMLDYNAEPSDSNYSLFSNNEQGDSELRQHLQQQQQQQQQQQNQSEQRKQEDRHTHEYIYDMASDTTRPMPWELKRETSHIPFNSTPPDAVFGKPSVSSAVAQNVGNASASAQPPQMQGEREQRQQLTGASPREPIYDMASDISRPPPWEMKRQTSHIPFSATPPDATFGQGAAGSAGAAGSGAYYQHQQQKLNRRINTAHTSGDPEPTPEFPAHMTSMESSISDVPPDSSQGSMIETRKPAASSLADRGTYTCTYHGCSLRFDSPQKLQRHKREGHRGQQNILSHNQDQQQQQQQQQVFRNGSTSPLRNSQAGPHRCTRINPTTGKPCETVFSRPYDLTRHEDTIHNARKQKVRCALCVEEKTFSRNDALTRHMRVVHPEVDFPGKHRKRGSAGGD